MKNVDDSLHALEITEIEIERGYQDLRRLLTSSQAAYAVKASLGFVKVDAARLWRFLKSFASTDLNYRDTEQLRTVDALYNSWVQDPGNIVYIAHAVVTLANAGKTRSDSVLKFLPNIY